MLVSLHIENIAVIREIDLEFDRGFTVLTGETGAGKSIIIDAIHLILGGKPSRELIRNGEDHAMVSAVFASISPENQKQLEMLGIRPDEEGLLMVQRTIYADGRAQTRLNGRMISVSLQREAMGFLLNIHGQHENQNLLRPQSHIAYLDRYADDMTELQAYRICYEKMQQIREQLLSMSRDEREKNRLLEQLKFQIADIDAARLKSGEEEMLEAERKRVKNIEKISKHSKTVYRALYRNEKGISACDLISRAASSLQQLSDIMPDAEVLAEKLECYSSELEDIAQRTMQAAGSDIEDPVAALDRIETRLDAITKMERKYGATVADVLAFRTRAAAELEELEHADERIEDLKNEYRAARSAAEEAAAILHAKRADAAVELSRRVTEELAFLDMEKVRFYVDISAEELTAKGGDAVSFLIATNAGEAMKPLDRIASGGELSRLMLAIKSVLADRESTETLIFDEVDTGISGRTSQRIGIKLKQTSSSAQVLCVTHAAQIAALAHHHYYIAKHEVDGRTETTGKSLNEEERVRELARIMGGMEMTPTLLASARELLQSGYSL